MKGREVYTRGGMLFLVPLSSLGADVCNPLPGFVPSYKTVGYEQSPGCRLHPEVTMLGHFHKHLTPLPLPLMRT